MRSDRLIYILSILCVLFVPNSTWAQKKQSKAKSSESHNNALFEQLLPSTAKVMFIDSIVVDKNDDFLKYIPIDQNDGSLTFDNGKVTYENGFGNYRLFSYNDTTNRGIFAQSLMGNGFSTPLHHAELSTDIVHAAYPFLAPDGKTLYFSGEGKHSIGKRDIFMSVYNRDDNSFYEPENCGLPFNSEGNDYLLVIYDYDTLGWLVSDRYQPEGKLCIYTFEPTAVRETLSGTISNQEQLRRIARLHSISDTWSFGDRQRALKRLESLKQRLIKKKSKDDINFVINDRNVYHSLSSFRSQEARQLCAKWLNISKSIDSDKEKLDLLRKDGRENAAAISTLEQELQTQLRETHRLEKQIRKLEN